MNSSAFTSPFLSTASPPLSRQTDISHLGMSALTRQDIRQEFLKAPPLLVPRVHKRYTATVVVWRPTRVFADTALYGNRFTEQELST
ncbi:hypothetical protein EVAR_76298_1 [Eumeta japonica]|uniref:Uncharacterized protein n=1 Tax=Eumeta variegata TaxID=151549 RepID=A0A4C1UP01_EUMVA|nr:hypothetical protein EVAR_76298_1 [Eumeta japonica]